MHVRHIKRNTRQVLSAEMRFSANKGLSAEMSAAVGFLAEKSEIEQIFWGECKIRAVCIGDCLLDDMPEHKFYNVSELQNFWVNCHYATD